MCKVLEAHSDKGKFTNAGDLGGRGKLPVRHEALSNQLAINKKSKDIPRTIYLH